MFNHLLIPHNWSQIFSALIDPPFIAFSNWSFLWLCISAAHMLCVCAGRDALNSAVIFREVSHSSGWSLPAGGGRGIVTLALLPVQDIQWQFFFLWWIAGCWSPLEHFRDVLVGKMTAIMDLFPCRTLTSSPWTCARTGINKTATIRRISPAINGWRFNFLSSSADRHSVMIWLVYLAITVDNGCKKVDAWLSSLLNNDSHYSLLLAFWQTNAYRLITLIIFLTFTFNIASFSVFAAHMTMPLQRYWWWQRSGWPVSSDWRLAAYDAATCRRWFSAVLPG